MHLHRNPTRLGFRANFMSAVGLCKSELIAFCDQDDIWYPEKLISSIEPFANPEVLMIYHDFDVVDDTNVKLSAAKARWSGLSAQPLLTLSTKVKTWGFTQLFRRSLLEFSNLWPCRSLTR